MSAWFVYVLRCRDNSLYTGVCTNWKRRLREHNGEVIGGARYTRCRRPVQIAYVEKQADRSTACQREAAIKKMSRSQKDQLIQSCNVQDWIEKTL